MNREQAGQRVLNRMKRKRVGRSGTKAMNVPVNNMSMADKFRLEQRRRLMNKRRDNLPGGMLTGGQAKIAAKAPPTNKIDAKDFAVLRKEKAKGRGQGLQDEKMKPGKIMKANKGGMGEAKGYKKYLQGLKKAEGSVFRAKYKAKQLATAGGKAALRAAKASRVGKIAAGVAGAALLGKAALEKMYEKRTGKKPFTKREPKRTLVDKKMGGGMMTMDDIIENMGRDYDYQTRIKFRKKSKGAPDQDSMKAYSEAEQDALKSVVKKYTGKMGGGMMRPMKAAGGAAIGAIAAGAGAIGAAALRANKKIADKAKEKKNKMRQEEFRNRGKVKRKMGGGMMMQRPMGYKEGSKGALKPTGIVLDAIRAYDKKQKPPKGSKKPGKMGGGMMMRPNPVGYKKGVLVKTKIGKNKPTKMY